ncbi:PAS domain S-box protein, partial [bacterium]|nr:PAS domain S-box protein [bacterium]
MNILFVNHKLRDLTGTGEADSTGEPLEKLFPYVKKPYIQSRLLDVIQSGSPAIFSSQLHPYFLECRTSTGVLRRFETHVSRWLDEAEENCCLLLSLEDVTDAALHVEEILKLRQQALQELDERIKAEEKLRAGERNFKLLAHHSTDMISRHSPDGIFLYVSPACKHILGYEPEELVGTSSYDYFHPDDLQAILASHNTIKVAPVIYTVQYRERRKDGSYIWFETTSKTIRDPYTDEVIEIIATSRDITERKRLEQELRQHRDILQALVNATHDFSFLMKPDGYIVLANDALAGLFDMTSDKIVGKNALDILPHELRESRARWMEQAISAREPVEFRDTTEGRAFHHWFHPVLDDDGKVRYLAVHARDVTEWVEAEELEREAQKQRIAYQLAATIAHEFNTPLGIIKGSLELLAMEMDENANCGVHLARVARQAERMGELVQKLLKISDLKEVDYAAGMKILDIHTPPGSTPPQ